MSDTNLKRPVLILMLLAAVWALLSGHFNTLLLTFGGISCLVCYVLYRSIVARHKWRNYNLNPLSQLAFLGWLLLEIFKANLAVIRAILNPKAISPQLFSVDTGSLDQTGKVIYANAITLTPGTVSVDLADKQIQVHGLLPEAKQELMDDQMRTRVERLMHRNS